MPCEGERREAIFGKGHYFHDGGGNEVDGQMWLRVSRAKGVQSGRTKTPRIPKWNCPCSSPVLGFRNHLAESIKVMNFP